MSECCHSCGSVDFKETIMNHGPHYARIDCADCGKFVKWAKKPEKRDMQETNKYTGGREGMNKVIEAGRLTKDPEMRYTQNNTAVCSFTLAVDRRFKRDNDPDVDFFPVVAWDKTAEFCGKWFSKGRKVIVCGRLQTRTWEDKENVKHYVTEIVAEEVDFADSKKDEGAAAPAGGQPQGGQPGQNQQPAQYQQPGGPFNPANTQQTPQEEPPKRMPWDKKPGEV